MPRIFRDFASIFFPENFSICNSTQVKVKNILPNWPRIFPRHYLFNFSPRPPPLPRSQQKYPNFFLASIYFLKNWSAPDPFDNVWMFPSKPYNYKGICILLYSGSCKANNSRIQEIITNRYSHILNSSIRMNVGNKLYEMYSISFNISRLVDDKVHLNDDKNCTRNEFIL